MVAPVTVLLATYNGLPYLDEQIRSLKAQTVPFRCLVQDDGSDDGTREVLETLFKEDPRFLPAGEQGQHLGAAANFISLLRQASGPVALCDQDDIWEADKLEVLMQALSQAEGRYGSGMPLLIHSDLEVIGPDGETIHPSFFRHQKWNPEANTLPQLLVQNNVTGCACLLSDSLRALIARYARADQMFMHDWFIAQSAACFGRIQFVDRTLVRYRQHGDNAIGASKTGIFGRFMKALAMPRKARARVDVNLTEAECLLKSYGKTLPASQERIIRQYMSIPQHNKFLRPYYLRKGNYLMQNPTLRLGQYLLT